MKKIFKFVTKRLSKKVVIVILVISGIFFGFKYYSNQKKNRDAETYTVTAGNVSEDLVLSGEVKADNYVQLLFPASGKISWVGIHEGDEVKRGQALTSLDKTTLNSTYQQALNNIRMYDANVDYVHDSLKDKASSETYSEKNTRTTAEVAKDNAYDTLKAAEYNLKNATLITPFGGIVTYLAHPFAGVNILPTEVQVEVVDPKTIYFEVTADQTEVTSLSEEESVKIILDSFANQEIDGKVTFISLTPQSADAGSVYKVRIELSSTNIPQAIRVGMTGDASFIMASKSDVLYAPLDFVKTDKNGRYVQKGSLNNKVYVKVGLEGEDTVEITDGVVAGDVLYN